MNTTYENLKKTIFILVLTDFTKNWYVGGYLIALKNQLLAGFYTLQFTKMENLKTNDFDFLDEINDQDLKNEKPKNKQDLWDYLDGFSFVNDEEVWMAVNDFFVEEMGVFNPSYWELLEYWELATEYMRNKWLIF